VIQRRITAWFEARLPRQDSQTLTQRNIYIVPTKGGLAFTITVLVMLVASINYQLSLGYLLTFLLAGSALASMHLTHGNLRGLTLRTKAPAPTFAGDSAVVEVVIGNPGAERHGIGLAVRDARPYHFAWCDVPAHGQAAAQVSFVLPRRGRVDLPTLLVETRFPLGLFRAWTVWRPASQALAWPRPEQPAVPLPPAAPAGGGQAVRRASAAGEFDGVRAWRRGDSLRQVVWKKAARSGELVSRDASESATRELWLEFDATQGDIEGRLSRLAAWVLAAERLGLAYGLRLPDVALPPAPGEGQRRATLDALALHGH
jgi:uncharacterized protein (DUF58 family)